MAAVDVDSLTVTYGRVTAVDHLSFQAEAGEVTCLLGPNGAGKTSTVEALEGLRRPASGRMAVLGLDPRADHRALAERMGVMLQEGGIHPGVRLHEALRHAAALYREPLDPRGLVERLGLAGLERRTVRQLSGGERRRLALALALVGRPQVAFLDEPTAGVDPAGRQAIRQVVADLRGDGVTVLLTTHDIDEAERVSDRVVVVDHGRLLAAGTVDELTRASGADAHVRFRAPAALDAGSLGRYLGGVGVAEVAPGDYVVDAEPTPRTVAAITGWLSVHDVTLVDLHAGRQRLEDVYLRLTAMGPPEPEAAARGAPARAEPEPGREPRTGPGAEPPETEPGAEPGAEPAETEPAETEPAEPRAQAAETEPDRGPAAEPRAQAAEAEPDETEPGAQAAEAEPDETEPGAQPAEAEPDRGPAAEGAERREGGDR